MNASVDSCLSSMLAIVLIGWGFQPRCDRISPVNALAENLASAAAVVCSITALIWATEGDVTAASHWAMGVAGCIYLARASAVSWRRARGGRYALS